ncbi:unnamed protein product [Somion occarium]|uniref:Uncharacterized protein n=1 Tax=Somion occarium TaxID=3059160 RepID=A0ABP1D4R3_9APHY
MPHLKEHNDVLLDRDNLSAILGHFSEGLYRSFAGRQVRLVVHGGAVMVLHRRLACRDSTRDIDFCLRPFVTKCRKAGIYDAEAQLNSCIISTAKHFGLGADWMNSHADVALPVAYHANGKPYYPVYEDAYRPENISINTIYESRGLVLIGVSWSWAVALKLVRYQKSDPYDIARILTLGYHQKGVQWTRTILENWLKDMCGAMGYERYPPQLMEETRERMRHAIRLTNTALNPSVSAPPPKSALIWHAPKQQQQPPPPSLPPPKTYPIPTPPKLTPIYKAMPGVYLSAPPSWSDSRPASSSSRHSSSSSRHSSSRPTVLPPPPSRPSQMPTIPQHVSHHTPQYHIPSSRMMSVY